MIILWVLTAIYVFFILFLRFGISKLQEWETQHFTANTLFSIVVPFRNDEVNLPILLKSIATLNYPKDRYELILVDEDSQDESATVCQEFLKAHPHIQGKVLSANPGSACTYKAAIESGIRMASHEYILTLGADCILPEGHLAAFNAQLLRDKVDMIVGPVAFPETEMRNKSGFLSDFQSLDLLSLQAATQGSFGVGKPFLCNGANLCYSKKGFEAVNGLSGSKRATASDILLLEKFLEADLRLAYLMNPAAVVRTPVQDNWKDFLSQRLHWTAATLDYNIPFGKGIGLLVFLTNFALVLGIPAMLFNVLELQHYAIAFVFKFNADFLLLYRTATFLRMESPMKRYLWFSVCYPFFSSWMVLKSIFSRYLCKDFDLKR